VLAQKAARHLIPFCGGSTVAASRRKVRVEQLGHDRTPADHVDPTVHDAVADAVIYDIMPALQPISSEVIAEL
jgi:hypothetical protein